MKNWKQFLDDCKTLLSADKSNNNNNNNKNNFITRNF